MEEAINVCSEMQMSEAGDDTEGEGQQEMAVDPSPEEVDGTERLQMLAQAALQHRPEVSVTHPPEPDKPDQALTALQ